MAAIALVSGWLGSLITNVFKAGRRDGELVTHKHLDDKLKGYARTDQLETMQRSIDAMRVEQREDFRTVIELIKDDK